MTPGPVRETPSKYYLNKGLGLRKSFSKIITVQWWFLIVEVEVAGRSYSRWNGVAVIQSHITTRCGRTVEAESFLK